MFAPQWSLCLLCLTLLAHTTSLIAAGVRGEAGCKTGARITDRLVIDKPGVYENIQVDGKWSGNTLVKITANDVTLRNCEIFNGRHNAITVYATNVVIESCKIHHLLNGTFKDQQDAHGITGRPQNLVIRNCEIYYVSGDAVQFDPGRGPWDNVLIENCTFWNGPLPADAAGFKKGERPGENALDTKQSTKNPRSRITVRNCLFHGWNQPGQIDNLAALNLKDHVEVTVEKCLFRDNEICFRLRGPSSTERGGALVTIKDCAVYDSAVALRLEDKIQNLKITKLAVGSGIKTKIVNAAGGAGPGYINEGEYTPPAFEELQKSWER